MPDITAAFFCRIAVTPVFRLEGTAYFPQNPFGGGNLVRPHDQQVIAGIKHRIMQQHFQQSVFLKKRGSKIFQILNRRIIGFRPIHRKFKTIFITLRGIGEITRIGTVGNHEYLQIFKQ